MLISDQSFQQILYGYASTVKLALARFWVQVIQFTFNIEVNEMIALLKWDIYASHLLEKSNFFISIPEPFFDNPFFALFQEEVEKFLFVAKRSYGSFTNEFRQNLLLIFLQNLKSLIFIILLNSAFYFVFFQKSLVHFIDIFFEPHLQFNKLLLPRASGSQVVYLLEEF